MQNWLTMNDGVRLDATLLRPEAEPPAGGWPAIVWVHGHGEDGSKASTLDRARRTTQRGYVSLCYSVRGQGGSEGLSSHLGAREIFDLQDVVRWVRALPGVKADRVAVCGSSQGGWHAWMAAAHTDVRTVVAENIFVNYADFAVPDGALSTWFFTRTLRRRVLSAGLQDLGRQLAIEGQWERLRAILSPTSPCWFADRITCPVMVVHGWHDVGMPSNDLLAFFDRLDVPKQLVLGGGGHEGQDGGDSPEVRSSRVDRWLDRWLQDVPAAPEPAIFAARRPGWEHLALERLAPTRHATLHLQHGGTLTEAAPLEATPNANVNHEPRDPSYDLGRALHTDLAGTSAAWPRETASFDGPRLDADLDLLGAPRFVLHVQPERTYFQVHAELWDVAPDGVATLITRGHCGDRAAVVGRHRVLTIETRAIAWRVAAGHHLRVIVADQNPAFVFPVYLPWRARLYHEVDRASHVVLPLG